MASARVSDKLQQQAGRQAGRVQEPPVHKLKHIKYALASGLERGLKTRSVGIMEGEGVLYEPCRCATTSQPCSWSGG